MRDPYAALEAFLAEHRLCRPGLDEPHVTDVVVALWCACGARKLTVGQHCEAARKAARARWANMKKS